MIKTFSIYGIVLTLMGGSALVSESMSAQPPAPHLKIFGLSFDNRPCDRGEFPSFFIKDNKDAIKVIAKSISYDANPFEVEFTKNGEIRTLNGVLKLLPPKIMNLSDLLGYDVSETMALHMQKLNAKGFKQQQSYEWTAQNGDALTEFCALFDISESPVLTLYNENLNRVIEFGNLEVIEERIKEHNTIFQLSYGFQGDPLTQKIKFYEIKHSAVPTPLSGIFYLDNQRFLRTVTSILYHPIPIELGDWAARNHITGAKYSKLDPVNPGELAIYPETSADSTFLKPEGAVLNKYYRFHDKRQIETPWTYIFADGHGQFYKVTKLVSVYNLQRVIQPTESICTSIFENERDPDGNPILKKLLTLEKTSDPFYFPENSFPIPTFYKKGEQNKQMQFSRVKGTFKTGFYKLNNEMLGAERLIQEWIEVVNCTDNDKVEIKIDGVNVSPVGGNSTIQLTTANGKIVFDLSTLLHAMDNTQYIKLKQYIDIAHKLEGKPPLITYSFQDKNYQQKKEACKWLTKILQDQYAVEQGHEVTIYTPRNANRSVWAVEFGKTSFEDTAHSIVVPRIGEPLREYAPTLEEVEFLNSQFDVPHGVWLGNQDQVKRIRFKNFSIQDFWNHKEWNPQLSLTVEHIAKTFSKAVGLETLNIPNLHLGDIFEDAFSRMHFHQGLRNNIPSLTYLNCEGTHLTHISPLVGFQLDSKEFVAAVYQMVNLKSINVLNTHLTNSDICYLAGALKDKRDLVDVRMDLPYWVSTGTEYVTRTTQNYLSAVANYKDATELVLLTLASPIVATLATPLSFAYGFVRGDICNHHGVDFENTYKALAQINNLSYLKLQIWGLRKNEDHIRNAFNFLRRSANKSPVTIEFAS